MKKIEELKRVLNFYVKSNILKTKVYDEVNNYTVSDCLYGAISLAIAMDSEFKESENVSRVIKMMILDEFSKNNPTYDLSKELKKGKELQELVNESRRMESKDSKLVFKYRMMDFVLTNLIKTRTDLSQAELIEEGIKCFNPKNDEEYEKYKQVVRYYILNSRLKDKNRSGWDKEHWNVKSDRIERIAEHIVSTILLAIAMESEMEYNEELDFDRNIDLDEIIKMLSIHEIGETLIGDITPFDGMTPEQKREIEFRAVQDLLGNLNNKTILLDTFSDFESKFSNEARFSFYCDKLEADLQSKYYQDTNQHRSLDDQETNKVMNLDLTKRLIAEGAKTPFDIWYAYDEKIYRQFYHFSEFQDLLTLIRDNNMLRKPMDPITEKIKLSDEEHEFLTTKIAEFLEYARHDRDVEAVSQINLVNGNKGMITIDLYVAEHALYARQQVMVDRLTEQFKKLNFTEIDVVFRFQSMSSYTYNAFSSNNLLRERLNRTQILLDKTGRLTRIRNGVEEFTNPFYTIKYVPPVEEEIKRKMIK